MAAGLLVSSVGIDDIIADLSGIMMTSVAADAVSKQGSSIGFGSLEKDTDGTGDSKIYNTNYGLHTDKTVAQAYPDGRTFDLDLESWYIGEKPADVGMVLDASGSMAWTTENPTPLHVDEKAFLNIKDYAGQNKFLSDDDLAKILVTDNTDNSRISYNKYQYYIYEARPSVSEFVPLGYWDGSLLKNPVDPIEELRATWESEKLVGFYPFAEYTDKKIQVNSNVISDEGEVVTGDIVTTSDKTYCFVDEDNNNALDLYNTQNGVVLDVTPSVHTYNNGTKDLTMPDALTISFCFSIKDLETYKKANKLQELISIGDDDSRYLIALNVHTDNNAYIDFYKSKNTNDDGSNNRLSNNISIKIDKENTKYFITFRIQKNSAGYDVVRSYLNGTKYSSADGELKSNSISSNPRITIGKNVTHNSIYIDDVYYFNKSLSDDNVKKLYENAQKQKVGMTYETLTDRAVDNKDNVLAQLPDAIQKAAAAGTSLAGWYYVNSAQDWEPLIDPTIGTGKQFQGLKTDKGSGAIGNYTAQNFATVPLTADDDLKQIIAAGNDTTDDGIKLDTETYGTSPVKFFIDSQGYLRCFFNSGGDSKQVDINSFNNIVTDPYGEDRNLKPYTTEVRTQCSLVYEKKDGDIKTQTLNKVLNYFVDQLQSTSQNSKISAMRFSNNTLVLQKDGNDYKTVSDYEENLKKLLLLDWTSSTDPNNKYSDDLTDSRETVGFEDNTTSSVENMYNYFLTGGTNTWIGLKAFADTLAKDVDEDGKNKYLILFTDGRDTMNSSPINIVNDSMEEIRPESSGITSSSDLASAWAQELKDDGYTIFCVMMANGSISPDMPKTEGDRSEYDIAFEFLETIASDESYVYTASSEENLRAAFTSILNQIKKPLTNYTVQDYIDPRFDLIDYTTDKENGTVLHLGAGGKVSGKTLTDAYATDPMSCDYTTKDGKTAKLYYDSDKDMYYLRWNEVAIPGFTSPFEGTKEEFDVWSSTITVKAKDDFIGGNAVLTNGNEAGMNLVFNEHSIKDETDKKAALTDLSGTDKANDQGKGDGFYPSKGFPRTTVNVRLLDIETKDLNDVIYLGEVVSPTIMLADLENDYLTGSYYLEYLERYAYRLYGASAESTPLIELLNEWLQIDNDDVKVKSFTIPYIYLPDPKYDGNKIEMVGGKPVVENNAGTPLNQLDILGYLTYTWETKDDLTEYGRTLVTDEFVASKPGQIKYQLSLKYTPLHEDNISYDPLVDAQFIPGDEVFFKPSGDNFNISADKNGIATNYDNVTVDTDTKWTFTNRQDYLRALVNENKDSNGVYEWDKDYKPTKGREQIERAHQYGDATKENDFYTLTANTTYTKDVVNAALALKLIVKGSDLNGSTTIHNGATYIFTASRTYDDELDPVYYLDPKKDMNANATDEKYTLTFTVGEIPTDTIDEKYYTIWATLSDIKDKDGTTLDSLPIGTYSITADMRSTDFVVKKDSGTGSDVYFDHLITDTDPANYKQELFPEAVTKESDSHKVYNNEYTIYDGTNDRSGENIANTKEENGTDSERTVTFYFGTKNDDGERGTRKVEDPDTKEEYVKDRLGIIVLSYGSGQLSISKEVTDTKEKANLDNEWVFDVTITSNEDMAGHGYYTLSWTDLEGNPLEGREPKTITFTNKTDNTYTAKINIKSGEKVTIEQLPDDAKYTVSETRSEQKDRFTDDYKYRTFVGNTSYETYSASGTAAPDTHVHFINQFPSAELPSAGGSGVKWYIIIGSALTVFSGVMYLYLYRRRKPAFKAHRRI